MATREMTDEAVRAAAARRVAEAVGYLDSTLSAQREQALKYYRGDPFGNEVEGRSQVVTREVAQHVDGQLPQLMRVFAAGDEVVRFQPSEPGDEAGADQATDYCNWVWDQNEGFTLFHTWFKDALLFKLGVVKIWWDEAVEVTRERYVGLTDAQLAAIQGDADIEVGEVTTEQAVAPGPDGALALTNAHDVLVTRRNKRGRVRIAPVPPEEFLFGRRAKSDRDADILAHRRRMSISDLIAMGYDRALVEQAGTDGEAATTSEVLTRFRDIDESPLRGTDGESEDATREVEVIEAYLRLDRDGDGIAELLKVCYSGAVVFEIEEVDDHPFAALTPIPMPHRMVGQSTADQVMDLQLVKSTIQRQVLDNLYLQNAPQMGAVESQVNLDDLLTRRPGGVVRMKQPGAIFPLPVQSAGPEPYQMLEMLDAQGEQRTGVTRYNQGLDADSLNKTARGIGMIQQAGNLRIELIARVFAETGVRRAFRRVLALACQHHTAPQMIRLRGQWVEMDPRTWNSGMDLSVSVGLGTGNRDQMVAHMMTLLQLDAQIIAMQGGPAGPLVTLGNVYAKLRELVKSAGLKGVEQFYTDPAAAQMQPQEPKPDPKMIEVQAKMALAQQEAAQEAQLAQQQAETDAQLDRWKAENQMQLEAWKARQQAELERVQAQADMAVERVKADTQAQLKMFEMQMQHMRDLAAARAPAVLGPDGAPARARA